MKMMIPGVMDETSNDYEKIARKLLKAGKALYVTNESDPRQIIFISYSDENGDSRSKNFPDSFLPVCITEQIPTETLLKSNDFWAYIRAGVLVPKRPKMAKAILREPESHEEVMRLKARQGRSATKLGRTIKGFTNKVSGQISADSRHPDDKGGSDEDYEPTMNKRMMHIMARVAVDKNTSAGLALAELKSIKNLSREDLGYLVGNGTIVDQETEASDNRITEWAMLKLTGVVKKESKPKAKKKKNSKKKARQSA